MEASSSSHSLLRTLVILTVSPFMTLTNSTRSPWLDGKHTIFGRVKSGLRVVQRMGLVKTDPGDKPVEEVKITRARPINDNDDI